MLEHEDVEEILKLLDATPLQQFELETDRFKITLRRRADGGWTQERRSRGPAGETAAAKEVAASTTSSTLEIDANEIRAPLVGTFYRSPKPGAPPFVEAGSPVGVDTVVAIVETMKLMTAIYAGSCGRIAEILIDDGQFVEQDQLLMRVVSGAP